MKFALANGKRQEAQPKLSGTCAACGSPMVASCGEVRVPPLSEIARRHTVEAGEGARRALRLLLAERRLSVYPVEGGGYRIEGFFELPLNVRTPRITKESGAFACVVAGARYDRSESALESVRVPFGA